MAARWSLLALLIGGVLGPSGCAGETSAARPDSRGVVEIFAVPGSKWQPATIIIPAGKEVTIRVINQDPGMAHNIVIKGLTQGTVESLLTPGPDVQEVTLAVEEPGRYDFDCRIHPEMIGFLIVQ